MGLARDGMAVGVHHAGSKAWADETAEAINLILARELRGRDITVNAVAPGPAATTPLFLDGKDQETIER